MSNEFHSQSGITNKIYDHMVTEINKLYNISVEPRKSMVGFYSASKASMKLMGLVWLDNPKSDHSSFGVHLRKETRMKYPQDKLLKLKKFMQEGWGGYPQFVVEDIDDAELALDLIRFAHQNL